MHQQQTLSDSAFHSGIGLHSGKLTSIAIHPAPPDTGIVFVKQVGNQVSTCPATIHALEQTDHCTTLQTENFQVQTVEHILSALAGQEIDNAYIEVQGTEIPAADGSATPFVEMLRKSRRVFQEAPRRYIKIVEPLTIEEGPRSISVSPATLPCISYFIDFPHPLIQQQHYQHTCTPQEFSQHIAAARTFAFREEVEYLWARGLGLGGSLNNTIVFSDSGLVNEDGLRFPDECVRHKVLDLIGDLALLGLPVIGHFHANRAGHRLHTQLVRAILDSPEKWILVNAGDTTQSQVLNDAESATHTPQFPELQLAFQSI